MSDAAKQNSHANTSEQKPEFGIQRIYVKDLSLEAPNSPEIFLQQWQPEIDLQLHTDSKELESNVHEVVLSVTVTVTSEKKTAFLVEVKQAGIFFAQGFPAKDLHALLGSVCPNILFPYARERVSDLVTSASFPQLCLAPVNFDALYAQHLQQQQQQQTPIIQTDTRQH